MNDLVPRDGEVQTGSLAAMDPGGVITRAEIDMQIATARAYPRKDDSVLIKKIVDRATSDEETAEECLYTLIRGQKKQSRNARRGEPNQAQDRENKPIEGPSIRLAEIAVQVYGNCRYGARVLHVDRVEGYVEAEGIFHDLEANVASRATIRRSIKGQFGLFSNDMIVVTGNAACAIAKRNAILAGIPKSLYRHAYQEARRMVSGTVEKLAENRAKVFKAFAPFGVKPEQLLEKLDLENEDEITPDHIGTLRGLFATIKNGEATVEEVFAKAESGETFQKVSNPLADDEGEGSKETTASAGGSTGTTAAADDGFPGDQPNPTDPLKAARERGAKAFASKMVRKAVPEEYAAEERHPERDAWFAGFDEAKAAAKA